MNTNISLVETNLIDEKIQIVMRQTDYNEEIARMKLSENGFDEIATIKSYLGVPEKKSTQVTSINQEIYKQLRHKLDISMHDYQLRVEKGETKKI
jgi:hypothetical protein